MKVIYYSLHSCVYQYTAVLAYVLVSGVELPDKPVEYKTSSTEMGGRTYEFKGAPKPRNGVAGPGTGSTEHHVHISIVLLAPLCRMDVLRLVRGPRKRGDEYAAPRNPKFTYAGWIIHHGKPGYKLPGEPLVRFEHGTLPMDALTTDNAMKIRAMLRKWGTDGMAKRFKMYTDLLERDAIKAKIERLQMSLEDNDA